MRFCKTSANGFRSVSASLRFKFIMVLLAVPLLGLLSIDTVRAEAIRSFVVELRATKDGSVDVTESIFYDFGEAKKHGIFRNIPVQYTRSGGPYSIDFHLIGVTDGDNNLEATRITHQGNDVNIRIGDPQKTVTHGHTYNIHYLLRRAVNFFDGTPEFYWNATGNEWPVPIEKTVVRFHPPEGSSFDQVKHKAYVGHQGSTKEAISRQNNPIIEYTCGPLKPGEGLTIVAGLPTGAIDQPSPLEDLRFFLMDWWPAVFIPIFTGFAVFVVWFHYGRDAKNPGAIPVEWDPPTNMTPAEVGTLVDERCDMQDIIATLIDLAARGHFKIKETQQRGFFSSANYLFTKTNPDADDPPLREFEKEFLWGVFGFDAREGDTVHLSDLQNKFYYKLAGIRTKIYSALEQGGYFQQNPVTVKQQYQGLGLFVAFVGLLMIAGGTMHSNLLPIGIGLFGSAAITISFAFIMPARTQKGVDALRQSLGFARFIEKAEKRRIEVLAQEDPTIFGRLLPYAMVLGAADKWADKFQDLMKEPPSWYEPYGYYTDDYVFSTRGLVSNMGTGMRHMESALISQPASSSSSGTSSGFSGGGFGGGGGGSW